MKILITENQLNRILLKETALGAPLKGNLRVNSPYSKRRCLKGQKCRPHHGTDYYAKSGTPIMSIDSGTVRTATFQGARGKCGGTIIIKHDNGLRSSYCHVKRIDIDKGDTVNKGDIIGLSGGASSDKGKGNSEGAHLHFGLKKGGSWVDPEQYVAQDVSGLKDIETNVEVAEGTLILWDGMSKGRKEMKDEVREMQTDLIQRNYVLPRFGVDGKFGPETLAAINAFQDDYGFEKSKNISIEVLNALKKEENINKNPQINDPTALKKAAKEGTFKPWNPAVIDAVKTASKEEGVPESLMFTIAEIESRGNPTAKNKRSGAAGLYQIMPKYFDSYGVTQETVWDPYANAKAAARNLRQKINKLTSFLRRPPTEAEVYVSHNQGTAGFKVIYTACKKYNGKGAKESLQQAAMDLGYNKRLGGRIYRNMKGNKGDDPCTFLNTWASIYDQYQNSYS